MVRRKSGFTLAEMLIVVAILGIMGMCVPRLFPMVSKFFILGKTKIDLQEQARAAMYIVSRELRQAQSSTIVIDQVTNQPYYSRITFTNEAGKSIVIYQNGSQIKFTKGTVTSILSRNLAYLSFTFPHSDDMTIMSVSFTLQEQIYGGLMKAVHMASEQVRIMN